MTNVGKQLTVTQFLNMNVDIHWEVYDWPPYQII